MFGNIFSETKFVAPFKKTPIGKKENGKEGKEEGRKEGRQKGTKAGRQEGAWEQREKEIKRKPSTTR